MGAASRAPAVSLAIEAAMGAVSRHERTDVMATIGTFKKTDNEYVGEIVTLGVQARTVRITPQGAGSNDKAPSHRVFVGRAEIGAAWTERAKESGRTYLAVKLDDPSFAAPIFANLFEDSEGEGYSLIWSRPTRQRG